jgi:hypothetical protein
VLWQHTFKPFIFSARRTVSVPKREGDPHTTALYQLTSRPEKLSPRDESSDLVLAVTEVREWTIYFKLVQQNRWATFRSMRIWFDSMYILSFFPAFKPGSDPPSYMTL